jgi:hypothetical protein
MKLYTEEQVRKMLEVCIDSDLYEHILTFEDILKTETPIELPSDKEINDSKFPSNAPIQELYNDGWEEGAKWMRDKIQGGKQ